MSREIRRGREILRSHARRYADLVERLRNSLHGLSDADLKAVDAACDFFGTTNCGWDEYGLMKGDGHSGRDILRAEQRRRDVADREAP